MARQMVHFRYDPVKCQKMVKLHESPDSGFCDMNGEIVVVRCKINQMTVTNQNPWPGHSALVGKVERKWQNTEHLLSFFADTGNSRRNYSRYVKTQAGQLEGLSVPGCVT
jgi:hypothetical protein